MVSNAPSSGRGPVIRYLVILGVGYVLGSKAGRRRYEQIAGAYKAVTESPAAKAVIDAGRRKIADRVSPDPALVTLTPIDSQTDVLQPEAMVKKDGSLADLRGPGVRGHQRTGADPTAAPVGPRVRAVNAEVRRSDEDGL